MKIRSVKANNRKKAFEIKASNRTLHFPYSKLKLQPGPSDPLDRAYADKELGEEAFTYVLKSGKTGTVHIEQVLEYNKDPWYLRDELLYKLTIEAQERLQTSRLSKREVIRRLGTSATQFYRLLDQKNYRKSIDQLLSLLHILDCEVDLVVRSKNASRRKAA
jgi:predicted XRE-type DNA-binding protein